LNFTCHAAHLPTRMAVRGHNYEKMPDLLEDI
jgi:hypothetical protein